MRFFPINKEKYDQLTEDVQKLYSDKKAKATIGRKL